MEKDYLLENEKFLQKAIAIYQIDRIAVRFSGYGDSGQMDDVEISSKLSNFQPDKAMIRAWQNQGHEHITGQGWRHKGWEMAEVSLYDLVADLAMGRVSDTGIDWYNNKGGQGEWEWDASSGLSFYVDVNVTEQVREHQTERMLGSYDEEDETQVA